jgi:hypothetical protein
MKFKILTGVILFTFPFFVSSTESLSNKASTNQVPAADKVVTKEVALEKEKELVLIKLLVKSTDKCDQWPLCD